MITITAEHGHDVKADDLNSVRGSMQQNFIDAIRNGPIFRTDASDLFTVYLDNLPINSPEERQHYTCNACRDFFERYGDLVIVNDQGELIPIAWLATDTGFYQTAIDAVRDHVAQAKITAAFYSSDPVWGTPEKGGWTHFSLTPPREILHRRSDKTAGEMIAYSKEKKRFVVSSFADIKPPVLDEALRILKSDTLDRSDRFIGPLQWLRDLHDRPKGRLGENLLWKVIMLAPEGYCHPRSAVTNTLLSDIEAGMSFDVVQRRWNAKVHPLQFQRPQSPPAAGTILAAEKLVEQLGIARSFERRFARLDEVNTSWSPAVEEPQQQSTGIFSHLKAKDDTVVSRMELPSKTMTWEKFAEKILPTAKKLQIKIPSLGMFSAMVTAEHADAPPIMKWDHDDNRYPVSWYQYHEGSRASQWGLAQGQWSDVTAIASLPTVADDVEMGNIIIVNGARDSQTNQGNALFPENLRNELHGIRSVVESYSKLAVLGGYDTASACGLLVFKGNLNYYLKVFDGKGWESYHIDRWE